MLFAATDGSNASNSAIDVNNKWLIDGNLEPKETVLENWQLTYEIRRKLLLTGVSVSEYYAKYVCLSTQQGIELVRVDIVH